MIPRVVAYAVQEFSRRKGNADSFSFREFCEFSRNELLKNWGLEPGEKDPDICADLAYLAELSLIRIERDGELLSNKSGWWQAAAGFQGRGLKNITIRIVNKSRFASVVDSMLAYGNLFGVEEKVLQGVLRNNSGRKQMREAAH